MSRTWDLLRKSIPEPGNSLLDTLPVDRIQLSTPSRIEVHTAPRGPFADRFRLLRLRLLERCHTDKIKTILITSALPHDGKSTVTLNLATALAEKGKRNVLLVGADLHRATLSEQLGIPRRPGLAECLEEGLQPLSVIRRVEPLAWYLLPAGSAQTNPTELVQNGTVAETLKDLSRYFDWILIDSPPLTPLADALALNQLTDATLLVARAGRTPVQEVEKAVGLIGRKRLLGIVLNGVEGLDRVYSNYYGSYGADPAMKGGETGN